MKKQKKYRLKKEIKNNLKRACKIACILFVVCSCIILYKEIKNTQQENQKRQQETIQQYKQCIYNQHKQQGYIIRSYCSNNWKSLDTQANIQYKQKGFDIYLVSIDNLEI